MNLLYLGGRSWYELLYLGGDSGEAVNLLFLGGGAVKLLYLDEKLVWTFSTWVEKLV